MLALREVNVAIDAGRVRRDHGRVGQRQEHADEHPRLPRPADRGASTCSRASTSAMLDDTDLAGVRNRVIGFVFQSFNLIPRTTRAAQRRAPAGLRGGQAARARRTRTRRARDGRARGPAAAQALGALRRPAAARRGRARDRHRPARSCSPTSRPATSTPRSTGEMLDIFDQPAHGRAHDRADHARAATSPSARRRVVRLSDGRDRQRRVPGSERGRDRRTRARTTAIGLA